MLKKLISKAQENYVITAITIVIFLLSFLSRVIFLDKIPTVLSHDELNYVINSVSVAFTGTGKSGEWHPLSITPVESTLAELPAVFNAPFMLLPFSNIVNARILFVFISLSLPFFIALISYELTKSKNAAYLTWVIALFNPWLWQNGRMTFDIPISLWFYVLGVLLFLKIKGFWKLISLVPFFLGFYCYQGFKLILPFIGVALSTYTLFKEEKLQITKKQFSIGTIFIASVVLLFGFYYFFQFSQQASSLEKMNGQILTPASKDIASAVDTDRRLSLTNPLTPIFTNKYLQFGKEVVRRYMLAFGWKELFFEISASSSSFSVWSHGMFYLLDIALLLLGFIYLGKRKQYITLTFIILMLAIGAIPVALNQSVWLFFRHSFAFPFLIILMGIGWSALYKKSKFLFGFSGLLYSILIINFAFIYFVRYPIFASENIFFSPRLVSEYVRRIPKDKEVYIFENEVEFTFTSFIFYNDLFNKSSSSAIQNAYKTKKYDWNNIHFRRCVPYDLVLDPESIYLMEVNVGMCGFDVPNNPEELTTPSEFFSELSPVTYIKRIKDSGDDFKIFGKSICQNDQALAKFIHPQKLSDFDFSKQSDEEFCKIWITGTL